MEEEKEASDGNGRREATGTSATEDPHAASARRGPGWKGWVLSILVAILLSVAATLLLGGASAFRRDRAAAPGAAGFGCGAGSSCCPPADTGK
jgi:Na+(H+)/acetate symporter ActP